MNRYDPGFVNVIVVDRVVPAGTRHLGRARPVDGLRPRAVPLVDVRVADDELVVDRVVVAQHERDRDAGRDADPRLVVVRVADPDGLGDRAEAGRVRPRGGDPGQAERQGDAAGQGETPRPAMRVHPSSDAHGQAIDSGGRRRTSSRIPPMPPMVSVSPTMIRMKSVVRSTAAGVPGRSRPAATRDGAPAPLASIARSKASCGAEASMRTLDSQPERRHPAHALVGAEVVEQRLGRRGAVAEAQAVVAGRGGEQRRRAVGEQVDVGLDAFGRGLAEGQDAERDPRVVGRDRDVDRRPVTDRLAAGGGRIGIEHGGQEDRRARRVEVEHLGGVGREPEAVLGRPGADRRRAAAQDGHVERVDADLHQLLGGAGRGARAQRGRRTPAAGSVSWISRWRVQSPPFSTLDGIPGSGVNDPNAPPPPANWKAVM